MIYSTVGILERKSVFQKNGKFTITYDVSDPVDFIDDEDYEDFKEDSIGFKLEDEGGSNISFNLE